MNSEPADILDLIHDSVVIHDAAGRVCSWNSASEQLYGVARAEAVGRLFPDLLESYGDVPVPNAGADRWEGEVTRVTAAGNTRVLDIRWSIERDADGSIVRIVEMARDISRRRAAEDALVLSEYRYRNMFQAMAVAFWEVDFTDVGAMLIPLRDQGVTDLAEFLHANRDFVRETMERATIGDLNPKALELFGAGALEDMKGRSIARFWPRESEPVYIDALVATMTKRPHLVTETRLHRLDGEPIDVMFTVSLSQEARRRGVMLIGVIDISERKAAEVALQRVRSEFAHAARVSMLGELTASIAHEVNQPLAAIATSASAALRWLARDEPDLAEVHSLAERTVADARRAADIIGRIRAMAERREPEQTVLSVNTLVENVRDFLSHDLAERGAEVRLELDPARPHVRGDRTQLQQLLVNLAVNAVQAMADAEVRRLTLSTGSSSDGGVMLVVEDTGPGLPDDTAHLFESFFTTKPEGMGMGLPICRTIVEAHRGTISAERGAIGARFLITLPAASDHTKVLAGDPRVE